MAFELHTREPATKKQSVPRLGLFRECFRLRSNLCRWLESEPRDRESPQTQQPTFSVLKSNSRWCALVAAAVTLAAAEGAVAQDRCPSSGVECFVGLDGGLREAGEAYATRPGRRPTNHARAALEQALTLGAGAVWYFIEFEDNRGDWDYGSWAQRFDRDAFRYDNNVFPINFVYHPLSGTAWHLLPRANGMNLLAAATYGLLTSWSWEFFLEFRERISINDTLVTTGAGVAMGEFFHKLALYVNSAPGGGRRRHRAIGALFGPSVAMHRAMDGLGETPAGAPTDAHGYSADLVPRLRLSGGASVSRGVGRDAVVADLSFDGRIVAVPGFSRPGRFTRFFADGDVTRLSFQLRAGAVGTAIDLGADTILLGHFGQRLDVERRGAAVVVGTSLGYVYRRHDLGDWTERLGLVALPGMAVDLELFGRRARLFVSARAQLVFGGAYAQAYDAWQGAHPEARAKTVLRKQGYYFGWGALTELGLRFAVGPLELEGHAGYVMLDSREGLDRSQEEVDFDIEARDHRLDYEVRLRGLLGPGGFFVETWAAGHRRVGRVGDERASAHIEHYGLGLGLLH